MPERELREKVSSLCHTQWSGWMKYMFSLSVRNKDGTITIPEGLVERWDRQMTTPYSQLRVSEKESDRKEADRFIKLILGEQVQKTKANPKIKELIIKYKEYCKNIKGFVPEITYGAESRLLKSKLRTYKPEDLEELFDWYLNNEISNKFGAALKTCLSNYSINMWLKDRHKYD